MLVVCMCVCTYGTLHIYAYVQTCAHILCIHMICMYVMCVQQTSLLLCLSIYILAIYSSDIFYSFGTFYVFLDVFCGAFGISIVHHYYIVMTHQVSIMHVFM